MKSKAKTKNVPKLSRKTAVLMLALPGLLLFAACQGEQNQNKSSALDFVDLSRVPDDKIYFECQDITQKQDSEPHHELFLILADNKTKVGEIEACDVLPREKYAQHQIPDQAIQAVGGLSGNTYSFVYAIRDKGDKLLVRQGSYSPSQTDSSYHYRTILAFSGNELSTNPAFNPAQLTGVYGHEEGEHAWMLFISMNRQSLTAQLFELDQKLPPFDQIADALKAGQAIPELLHGFRLNTQDMSFSYREGGGKVLLPENGPTTIIFSNRKDSKGNPLTLKKLN